MKLVEQHIIERKHIHFQAIDGACFDSKNLYNATNYQIRQSFFETGQIKSYPEMAHSMKDTEEYKALPAKVSQQVLLQLSREWTSYWEALSEWKKHPQKFRGKPKIPHYKDKQKGRNLLVYTKQALSKPLLKKGIIKPSQIDITVKTQQEQVRQVRIVPKKTHYVVEVVYEVQPKSYPLEEKWIVGIDVGLNNLAAIASNKQGFIPLVVNGRPLKSINQFYNKKRAEMMGKLQSPKRSSRGLDRLTQKRNRRIRHALHVASRRIVEHLVLERIGTLVIGKNPFWKQEVTLGSKNNQNFVSVPHAWFVSMLKYKAQLFGIKVLITEESYTSKCSFLDQEPLYHQEVYMGKRIKRGLFLSAKRKRINADLNGSYNIIRKVAPNAFSNGVEGVVVHPVNVSI